MILYSAEYRIIVLFTYIDVYCLAVFKAYNAVKGKRNGNPLVLFDSAVVVGVQVNHEVAFVKGVLLDVKARGIDVGSKNVHSLFDRL